MAEIAQQFVTSYNDSDMDLVDSLYTDDVVFLQVSDGAKFEGKQGMKDVINLWKGVHSDGYGEIVNTIVSDDGKQIVVEVEWHGTLSGKLEIPGMKTVENNGNKSVVKGIAVLQIEGDKIKNVVHYFDMLSFAKNMGAWEYWRTNGGVDW